MRNNDTCLLPYNTLTAYLVIFTTARRSAVVKLYYSDIIQPKVKALALAL